MNEKARKDLMEYAKPTSAFLIVGIILIIISPIAFFKIYDRMYAIAWGLGAIIVGLIFIVVYIKQLNTLKKKLKEIDESGASAILAEDFASGGRAFDGRLILGRRYIIGKWQGTILSYDELVNVYQQINRTNGIENSRTLIAVTNKQKNQTLCELNLRGKSDDELMQVINYMTSVNPNITVGYKK